MWFSLAITAYLLFAAVKITDRHLLRASIPLPIGYAFYVGVFSLAGSLLLFLASPFFLGNPFPEGILTTVTLLRGVDTLTILTALLAGILFIWALIGFFSGMRVGEASRVVPSTGAVSALFVFVFARLFLGEALGMREIAAFLFLVAGGILISLRISKETIISFYKEEFLYILLASFFFGISWVLRKMIFSSYDFIIGFIWINLGMFLGVLVLPISRRAREEIFQKPKDIPGAKKIVFLANQVLGGSATLLQNLSVALGSVTLVNGLQGLEHFFILVLTLVLAAKFPKVLREEFGGIILWQKISAVFLIGTGLYLLAIRVF